jgi:hypothetical protein
VGEQARFALRREQVAEARVGPGAVGWQGAPRVYVTWRDEARKTGGIFSIRPADVRAMHEVGPAARRLAERLQAWREGAPATEEIPLCPALPDAPQIGQVTSLSPRAAVTFRAMSGSLVWIAALAFGASVLFGLSFNPAQGGAGLLAVAAAALSHLSLWLPHLFYREQ